MTKIFSTKHADGVTYVCVADPGVDVVGNHNLYWESVDSDSAVRVVVGTAADVEANTKYVRNTLGVGARADVRAVALGAVTSLLPQDVVNGVTIADGDRVLLVSQADPVDNGVYIVTSNGSLTRASDMLLGDRAAGTTVRSAAGVTYTCLSNPGSDVVVSIHLMW